MKVIGNKEHVVSFLKMMVPLPKDDHVYLAWMVARKKYNASAGGISRSEEMLSRTILYSQNYDDIIRKIMKFEVSEECFVDYNTKTPIPWTNYATYIDLTPKSMAKSLVDFSSDIMQEIWAVRTEPERMKRLRNIEPLLFSKIHKSNAIRKPYKIIDVDDKGIYERVRNSLVYYEIPIKWITETHGGFHIIVPIGPHMEIFYKSFVPLMTIDFGPKVEILENTQTPICGTYQGGFLTNPADIDYWESAKTKVKSQVEK
jgi:hypothetical protein